MTRAMLVGMLFSVALSCGGDPVHDSQVSALGPETGVSPGPQHRPGQPCLTCHGGSGPASTQFSMAGTVFGVKDKSCPLAGVQVQLTDANRSQHSATTNDAGNFYVPLSDWAPVAPVHVALTFQMLTARMTSHIGRDGSCADCHYEPPSPATPGIVYMAFSAADLPAGVSCP